MVGIRRGNLLEVYTNSTFFVYTTFTAESLDNNYPLTIGARFRTAPAGYWPGSIDDVRIYNRALSASEIQALYNATR